MKNFLIILFLTLLLPKFLLAQICSGVVIDKDSEEPLVYANVFIEGTLTGTTTDENGHFELDLKGNSSVPVVISFVGYVTKVLSLEKLAIEPIVKMEKEVLSIEEIVVKSNSKTWPRKKMMQIFKQEFLGTSYNAKYCKIKNEDDIYLFYNDKTRTLHANSRNPIVIENKNLGYRIYYLLEKFLKSGKGIQYFGYSRFEELEFNGRRKKKIELNRKEAYLGSIMHFIRFLYEVNLNEKDTVYDLEDVKQIIHWKSNVYFSPEIGFVYNNNDTTLSQKEIIDKYTRKYEKKFQLYDSLQQYVPCKELVIQTSEKRLLCFDKTIEIKYLGNLRTSYMRANLAFIEIFPNGYFHPEQISWYGSMFKQRIGDLLPFDYKYDASGFKD